MLTKVVALAAIALPAISAAGIPSGAWPANNGYAKRFTAPYVVEAGKDFDGGMKIYERSDITCQGQTESSAKDAVFIVKPGGKLRNVIIGKNQMEGVHCDQHDCTIENVWWEDVCEDAFTIKGGSASSVTKVIGGGARFADDKVIQHNGQGTVSIDGFYAQDFGKLYRSCGTCGSIQRKVQVSNVYAVNPKVSLVTVNSNNNDVARISNIKIKSSKAKVTVCARSAATNGGEPTIVGEGPDGKVCIYDPKTIQIIKGRLRSLEEDHE